MSGLPRRPLEEVDHPWNWEDTPAPFPLADGWTGRWMRNREDPALVRLHATRSVEGRGRFGYAQMFTQEFLEHPGAPRIIEAEMAAALESALQ